MLKNKIIVLIDHNSASDNGAEPISLVLLPDPRLFIPATDALKKSGFKGKMKVRWITESVFDEWSKNNSKTYNAAVLEDLAVQAGTVQSMTGVDDVEEDDLENVEDKAIIEITNELFDQALRLGASDIHIEPHEAGCIVRYRIDGVLIPYIAINEPSKVRRLVNRLKVLGNMDVNDSRIPQSGKIRYGRNDIRVSTMPSVVGEKVVLRVLNNGGGNIRSLEELGVPKKSEERLRKLFTKPYGIILISGPTGSGKSSTLAAILKELCTEDVCMITIEDPVEYRIHGAVQVNINDDAGLTFHETLRETLRQDPNILMIGEIRDKETAEIAMQAANTGHLVFSTIHTNSAASAITRLNDMGIDGYLVADNIICIVSQSLVRKLCPHCKEKYIITQEDCDMHDAPYSLIGKEAYRPGKGCNRCNDSGYSGRTIAFEILEMTPKIMAAVHDKLPTADIEKIATELSFQKKLDYAYGLVEAGITSLHEVRRIIGGIEIEKTNN